MSIHTPWGQSDYEKQYADGITFYGTPSHGGFKLDRKRNADMPAYMRRAGGWYEEDCEWSLVALVHPEAFTSEVVAQSHATAMNWYPDEYSKFLGVQVDPRSSYVLRKRIFEDGNARSYVAIAAWGSWHERVPTGMVGVCATLGGLRGRGDDEKYFLVPEHEYKTRQEFGFVIDPARHQEQAPIK